MAIIRPPHNNGLSSFGLWRTEASPAFAEQAEDLGKRMDALYAELIALEYWEADQSDPTFQQVEEEVRELRQARREILISEIQALFVRQSALFELA